MNEPGGEGIEVNEALKIDIACVIVEDSLQVISLKLASLKKEMEILATGFVRFAYDVHGLLTGLKREFMRFATEVLDIAEVNLTMVRDHKKSNYETQLSQYRTTIEDDLSDFIALLSKKPEGDRAVYNL